MCSDIFFFLQWIEIVTDFLGKTTEKQCMESKWAEYALQNLVEIPHSIDLKTYLF